MRMVHAIQENTTEGAQQVKQTGVGGDAKIVYALLTGMVSDKVVYPVREYATNAWEVSPPTKPAEIELPTRFNPTYTIRDFGPGLPHKFMMDSYAKIGVSTKDNDDDAVGGWGFGSKAALAYLMRSDGAGSFTVTSRFRGFRRVYVIGVSEQGKIQIQFMGEWPLEAEDRGTGLEVSFPVRDADISRFHDHAKAVLWSFNPRPKVTPAIDFGTPKVLHSGDGWTIYDGGCNNHYNARPSSVPFSGPQVMLGPVMYPLDIDLMPACDMFSSNTCIVFTAKIGTISVSASRERLQYDDRTEAGLVALFEHYRDDWMVKAKTAIDAETTLFKARCKAEDISRTIPGQGFMRIVQGLGWRGFEFHADLFPGQGVVKAATWPEIRGAGHQPVVFRPDWKINPAEVSTRTVVIQHASNRSAERFALAGLINTPCLWVRCKRADLDFALDRMGRPEYIVLDDVKLPKQERGAKTVRPESVKRVRVLSRDLMSAPMEYVDHDDEVIYCFAQGRGRKRNIDTQIDGTSREFGAEELNKYVRQMREAGILDDDLRVVALDPASDVVAPAHWIHLGDHLAEVLDAAIDVSQLSPTVNWSENAFPEKLRLIRDRKIDLTHAPAEIPALLAEMADMLSIRRTLVRDDNEHDTLAALNLKITGTDLKSVVKDPTQPIRDRWNDLLVTYPLLQLILKAGEGRYYDNNFTAQVELDYYFQLAAK